MYEDIISCKLINIIISFRENMSSTATGLEPKNTLANGWVFVYEVSGCGFESGCCHLNFRFCICFEQGVPWHSGNYRV